MGVLCELFGLEEIDYKKRKEVYPKTLPLSNSDLAYVLGVHPAYMGKYNNFLSDYPTGEPLRAVLKVYGLANEKLTSNDKLRIGQPQDHGVGTFLLDPMSTLKLIDRPDRLSFIGYSDRFKECWPDIENFRPEYNQRMNSEQKRSRAPKDWQQRRIKAYNSGGLRIDVLKEILKEQGTAPR